jgi:hypothetical protein
MPSSLLQVVNSLFEICLGTSSANTTCRQLVNTFVTTCLQTCNNLCVFTCITCVADLHRLDACREILHTKFYTMRPVLFEFPYYFHFLEFHMEIVPRHLYPHPYIHPLSITFHTHYRFVSSDYSSI